MKIGIDLRFLWDNLHSLFVSQLVEKFMEEKRWVEYTLYTNSNAFISIESSQNVRVKKVKIENNSLSEQISYNSILKKDKNDLMVFFNHHKPIFYKKDYIIFVLSLKDLYYTDFESSIERYKFQYLISKNIKNAKKLICLDTNTKQELIERFNIKETNISLVDGFFPKRQWEDYEKASEELPISIPGKYNISWEYFIYSGGGSIEKNFEKLINVFERLIKKDKKNINLVFLGNEVGKHLNMRQMILEKNLNSFIHFIGSPEFHEKRVLYKHAKGVIFPSLYEPFPFRLSEPLYFWTKIYASNLKKIEAIFWEKIIYFSPISVISIYESIKTSLEKNINPKEDYSEIIQKYTVENTVTELLQIIK